MSKQTAVEFLEKNLKDFPHIKHSQRFKALVEEAKEMEKDQIIDARQDGVDVVFKGYSITNEEYYNETYGGDK